MGYYNSIIEAVGKTPAVKLNNYIKKHNIKAEIIVKLESLNPLGSVKDRIAYGLIEKAEQEGLLTKESHIIEATTGNFGIALAAACAVKGYNLTLVMPELSSIESRRLMKALGSKIILTDSSLGFQGSLDKAKQLKDSMPNYFSLNQYSNAYNVDIHYSTTGAEIYKDISDIDILVAGTGSGGTLMGVGKYLKEKNVFTEIYAVEPENSSVLLGKSPGLHPITGIGPGFIPEILDTSILDGILPIKNYNAMQTVKELARLEGILVGISSGAALYAARELAKLPSNNGKRIVVILPDTGERYLSTGIFE